MTITFQFRNLEPYQESQYSSLWSWYLSNINTGDFEKITHNTTLNRRLDSFISNNTNHSNSIILILILPTSKINKSPNFIGNLLSKFYDNVDDISSVTSASSPSSPPHNVTITPMGQLSELNASILMIKDDANQQINPPTFNLDRNKLSLRDNDSDSYISGDPNYIPSIMEEEEIEIDRYTKDSSIMSFDSESDGSHSIITGVSLTRVSTVGESDLESPVLSPIVKVESNPTFGTDERSNDTNSNNDEFNVDDEENFNYSNGSNGSHSSVEGIDHDLTTSTSISSTDYSLNPITSKIQTMTTIDNHRLILKSIVLKNLSTNAKQTAIRQVQVGDSGDDWLLYDEDFSMDNLELLSLDEIVEFNSDSVKLLFYTLEHESQYGTNHDDQGETHQELSNHEIDNDGTNEHDLTVVSFNGENLYENDYETLELSKHQSGFSTIANTPALSKVSTLRSGNYNESIKSEYLVHQPDLSYTNIQKSKSVPGVSNRKLRLKKNRRYVNKRGDKTCVIT